MATKIAPPTKIDQVPIGHGPDELRRLRLKTWLADFKRVLIAYELLHWPFETPAERIAASEVVLKMLLWFGHRPSRSMGSCDEYQDVRAWASIGRRKGESLDVAASEFVSNLFAHVDRETRDGIPLETVPSAIVDDVFSQLGLSLGKAWREDRAGEALTLRLMYLLTPAALLLEAQAWGIKLTAAEEKLPSIKLSKRIAEDPKSKKSLPLVLCQRIRKKA